MSSGIDGIEFNEHILSVNSAGNVLISNNPITMGTTYPYTEDSPLAANNTEPYTPVNEYNPATVKYINDLLLYKVDNNRVKTDVPTNAIFTDTQNTIENSLNSDNENHVLSAKQGKVLKTMIDNINVLLTSDDIALDEFQELVDYIKANRDTLNALDISNISGLQNTLDLKVDNTRVKTDVPDNALFTDTIYTKPTSEEISYISGLQDALDLKVNNTRVKTDVPENAIFTDTVYVHPTGDGNKHIPSNGLNNGGKILVSSTSAGVYTWESVDGGTY